MDTYHQTLIDLREHLARHRVKGWTERLDEWAAEWTKLQPGRTRDHLLRTKKSLAGMGSLGDIVISPEAGDVGVDTPEKRKLANARLQELVDRLYEEISQLLAAEPQVVRH